MSKKVLTTSLLTLSLAGLATGVLLSNRGNFAKQSKASGERTIVFNASTGASAKTSKGNTITLGSRYANEWTFGGEHFAVTSSANSFIDNFTGGEFPFQNLRAFTVNFTTDESENAGLYLCLKQVASYQGSTKAYIEHIVSGKRYELGVDPEWNYIYSSASDVFNYFYLNSSEGTLTIESLTIEYLCE